MADPGATLFSANRDWLKAKELQSCFCLKRQNRRCLSGISKIYQNRIPTKNLEMSILPSEAQRLLELYSHQVNPID